jgi:hypothetical protein
MFIPPHKLAGMKEKDHGVLVFVYIVMDRYSIWQRRTRRKMEARNNPIAVLTSE